MGIEPTTKAWEAFVLPLNYIRKSYMIEFTTQKFFVKRIQELWASKKLFVN